MRCSVLKRKKNWRPLEKLSVHEQLPSGPTTLKFVRASPCSASLVASPLRKLTDYHPESRFLREKKEHLNELIPWARSSHPSSFWSSPPLSFLSSLHGLVFMCCINGSLFQDAVCWIKWPPSKLQLLKKVHTCRQTRLHVETSFLGPCQIASGEKDRRWCNCWNLLHPSWTSSPGPARCAVKIQSCGTAPWIGSSVVLQNHPNPKISHFLVVAVIFPPLPPKFYLIA